MRYVTGETCFSIVKGPYLLGASFFEGILILRLRASNHTLLPVTNDLVGVKGLICLFNDFCASDLASDNSRSLCCALGIESSGIDKFVVGLMPVIN